MKEINIDSTVIFLDVRNFTPLMKNFSNDHNFISLIKSVYEIGIDLASSFCCKNDFYLNSTGDGFLCIFMGEDHYIKAFLFGILLIKKLAPLFESFFSDKDDKYKPRTGMYYYGIGIESGPISKVITDKGKDKIIETYLGNVINLAARIESLSKEHGRAPMLYGPDINERLTKVVTEGKSYQEFMKEAKDNRNSFTVGTSHNSMNTINVALLSSYLYEHNLKGIVDDAVPIFRISPTLLNNLNVHTWNFLSTIPEEIKTTFIKLYENYKQ